LPRQLYASGWWWLLLVGVAVVVWIVVATMQRAGLTIWVADHRVLTLVTDLRNPVLTTVMKPAGLLATSGVLLVLWWLTVVVLVVWRRWRHLVIWLGAMLAVQILSETAAELVSRPRPVGVEILGTWEGFSMPSKPMAILAAFLVNSLYSLVPAGRLRNIGKLVAAGLLAVTGLSRIYLAQDSPMDVLVGVIIGVAIPLAAWRLFAPNAIFPVTYRRGRTAHLDVTGRRHDAIVRAVEDQLGVLALEVKPFGLAGSGGSTPLRIRVKGDPDTYLFAKLYATTHLRSDRWYKLGRTLLYGRLEDEKAFNTVRRLVQYEDYLLRVFRDAGLPVPEPYGIVEITPEREYLLVTEFFDGAIEIGDAEVDDAIIDQALDIVGRMWHAGLAHRDIKPANLLVRDGRLLVIDSAFGQVRPSPWRQAVDLGNMMLVLALRTDPKRVYERAQDRFSVDEIAEAFAATRGLTMPSQLRGLMRQQGRDLHEEFVALLPYRPRPIRIQRWSMRRVGLILFAVLVAFLAVLVAIPLLGSPL
jgi:tRNA A-37 threonylcarbamoyl transferase component Bud32/membrane-associated phospholipid phosphatase